MKHLKVIAIAGALALTAGAGLAKEKLKMATIAPGTSAYLTMTTFASIVNQNQDEYEFTVDATGAATKHIMEVANGNLDYAMSSPTIHFFLKNQKAMYQKVDNAAELSGNLRLVMWFPYGQYHWIVHEDSGIKSFADMEGKRVFLGPPGGGAWAAASAWLKLAGGLDVKAGDVQGVKASWSSAFQSFQDRQIDVYVNGGIAPFPQVEQLALTGKIRLIGGTADEIAGNEAVQKYIRSLPGRSAEVIQMGTYGENVLMDHDISTGGAVVGITVRSDMSDDQVYTVTKAFWDNIDAARASTPWMAHINLEYAVQEGGLPLHPGAQRYYEEVGLSIPDGSKAP